jgi:hypothetical protein
MSSTRAEQKVMVIIGLEKCNMLSPLVLVETNHQALCPAGGLVGRYWYIKKHASWPRSVETRRHAINGVLEFTYTLCCIIKQAFMWHAGKTCPAVLANKAVAEQNKLVVKRIHC